MERHLSLFARAIVVMSVGLVALTSPSAFARQTTPPSAVPRPAVEQRSITPQAKNRVVTRVQSILDRYAFVPGVDFANFPTLLKQESENLDKATTQTEFANAVNAALRKYGMSHISLFTPSFGEARKTQKKAGLGIRLETTPKGLVVVMVIPSSPAADAGLQVGDLLVSRDGKPVKTVEDLAGEDGETSKIVIERKDKNGKAERITFEIKRRPFSLAIPESVTVQGDFAVVAIPSFDVPYDRANVDRVMEIAKKSKGIVLDLRGNGGGRVANLLHLMSHFFDTKTESIGMWVSKEAVKEYEKTNPPTTDVRLIAPYSKQKVIAYESRQKYTGKVAVLINGATGSASEMMAAGLKELRGAPIVGTKSAGAVLASILREIDGGEGFWIQYPMLDYVTIKGRRLEGNGIEPDQIAPTPRFGEPDRGVETAIALLNSQVALSPQPIR